MNKKKQLQADVALGFVCLAWGFSYLWVDTALREVSPLTLNFYRFGGAFLITAIFAFKKLIKVNLKTIKYSILLGSVLFSVFLCSTYGVKNTSVSNAGFLCGLTSITTPIFAYIYKGEKQSKKFILAVVMSVIGMGLLTLNEEFSMAWGDILCIITSFLYGVHLVLTEKAVSDEEVDAFQVGIMQQGVVGIYALAISLVLGEFTFPKTFEVSYTVVLLAVLCTGFAFVAQSIAQKYTTASHAGLIFALEPLFAGIVAFAILGEVLSVRAYIGAALLILSIFVMELDLKKLFGKVSPNIAKWDE